MNDKTDSVANDVEQRIRAMAKDVAHFRERDGFIVAIELALETIYKLGVAQERARAARICEGTAWTKRRTEADHTPVIACAIAIRNGDTP